MRTWLRSNLGLLTGLIAGAGVVAILLASGVTRPPPPPAPADQEFVAAWRRSREVRVVVDGEVERVMDSGAHLSSAYRLVQAPPTRLFRQFGSVSGERDGKGITCASDPDGGYACSDGPALSKTFTQELDEEIRNLRDHFNAPMTYEVNAAGDGCFDLALRRPVALPTFGSKAHLCFAADTGALVLSERHLEGAVETSRAVSVRSDVEPGDLDVAPDAAFEPKSNLGSATTAVPPRVSVPIGAPTGCPAGPTWRPGTCTDEELVALCARGDQLERVTEEMSNRQISINAPAVGDGPCGRRYAVSLLERGAVPTGPPSSP